MSRIIAGMFDHSLDADATLDALQHEGFHRSEVDAFYVSPPGQHAMTPVGGAAPHSSEGSRHAGRGAALGAVIGALIGAVLGLLLSGWLGLVIVPLGAGLGAYLGSFAGTMAKVRAGRHAAASIEHPVEQRGG